MKVDTEETVVKVADIKTFCQDIDALSRSFRYARRYTFSVPPVGSWVILIIEGNPAAVQITEVDGPSCTGVVKVAANSHTIKVGETLKGHYQEKSSEWYYTNGEEPLSAEDYRQAIIDMIKTTNWHGRYSLLPWRLRINNASMNLFLYDMTGEAVLSQTTTLEKAMRWTKTRGEKMFLAGLVFNVVLLLLMTRLDASAIQLLINGGCTLYSLYIWYNDSLIQKRMQKQFDIKWPDRKKEYLQLNDMINRYGLSPNRIEALHQWNLNMRNMLYGNLAVDMMPLVNAWYIRISDTIHQLDMEDTPNEQQKILNKIWALANEYTQDVGCFQKQTYTEK